MQLRVKVRSHFEEDHICKLRSVSKELNLYDVILRQSKAEQNDSVSRCCMTMTYEYCSDSALFSVMAIFENLTVCDDGILI
jgi:hypothetical protein